MNNLSLQSNGPETIEYIHESVPQWDNGTILNKNCVFRLENYGLVKMMFLKISVVPDGATDYPIPSSPYIFENIFLECNGVAFARVNTTYNLSRIDDLQNTGLYNKILNSSSFSGTFDSTQEISLPLFFYVIDGQRFNVSDYDNITIRAITKSSIASMGLSVEPLSITVKLLTIYDQFKAEPPKMTLKNYSQGERGGALSYNITSETHTVANLDTSKTIKLNNQSKVKSLRFMIRTNANAGIAVLIDRVKLRYTNGTEADYNNLTNFNFSSTGGTNDGKIFKIEMNSYTKINGNMNPTSATVYFSSLYTATLYVVYEYYSEIIEEGRMLMETFSESLF